jgi:D-alanyl-D-alanine carboxypeptidase/D-alanyl-D-alanine-endopeptidase (penicillin-binding protein 4)
MTAAYRDFRVGPELTSTLAIAGVDGTLRRRFAASPGRGRIRAKTGTLEAVSTLAGYVAVDGRRPLAFAILVNDIPLGQRGHARLLQDALLEACIAFLGAP